MNLALLCSEDFDVLINFSSCAVLLKIRKSTVEKINECIIENLYPVNLTDLLLLDKKSV